MNAALVSIGSAAPGRVDRGVVTDDAVNYHLLRDAPVAIGVSGGKDSCIAAMATVEYLDSIGHTGPRILIHSDLGRVEWRASLPTCERLAAVLGLELVVVRRAAGDMMDRWLVRWSNNVARYTDLSCVKLILPWSTPAMRFCTSELKTAVICRELVRRFPGQTIISVSGIRADESSKRRHAPVSKAQAKLTSVTHKTTGIDWHPVLRWTKADVFALMAAREFEPHEAYTKYGMSRVSCAFCIMSNEADLVASASCPDNHDVYREMVDLEIASTFAFQGAKWLGDVSPAVLAEGQALHLAWAKAAAIVRQEAEARIPDHLLYEKGWPKVMPTPEEASMLAEVRIAVARALKIEVRYTDGPSITARYAELMAENARRNGTAGADDDN